MAQSASQAPAAARAEPPMIQEVVVTARRRAESLQDVPVTITALSGADLEHKSLKSTEDLRNFVPGVNIAGLRRDEANFYIRGQGPGNLTTGQRNFSSVATYFAEVPTAVAGPGVFYDLANVQVLKGPQGTLFGRNTTGGAVLFEPNRPTQTNEGYFQVQGGNYGMVQLNAMLNFVAVPDKLAVRVAGETARRQGFTQSIYTGQKLDERHYDAFRASVLFTPIDGFQSVTMFDYRYKQQASSSAVIRALDPTVNLGGTVASTPALAALEGLGVFAGLSPAQVGSIPLTSGGGASIGCLGAALPGCPAPLPLPPAFAKYGGIAATLAAAYAGHGLALLAPTAQMQQILALQQQIGPRKTQTTTPLYNKQLDWGVTNNTTYRLTDNITLKNIAAFRLDRQNSSFDYAGIPLHILANTFVTDQSWGTGSEQFTEEFQLQGKAPSLKASYIVGAYYEDEMPGFLMEVPGLTLGKFSNRRFDHHDTSDAIFGHVEWNPLDYFGISGGVRQTWDGRQSSIAILTATGACNQQNPATLAVQCPIGYTGHFNALTYDATANLKPWQHTLVYLSYRHGYKSGGFNLPAPPGFSQTYQPEYVNEVELGVKSDFTLIVPVRIDGAVFNDDYTNAQTSETENYMNVDGSTGASLVILNNVKALNRGFELSATVLPTPDLSFSAFTSYLDAHATNSVPFTIVAGRQVALQPKWKYGLSGAYNLPVPEDVGKAFVTADWSWQSEVFTTNFGGLVATDPAYGVLNARAEWDDVMKKGVDLAVFATNLLDKTYVLGGYPIAQLGMDSVIYGEPRMYGVSLKYRFGERAH